MKSVLIIIVLSFIQFSVFAQIFPSDLWHDGKLVLVSEDTLVGKLKYDLTKGIVQVEVGKKLYTHSAKSIFFFTLFDVTSETYRTFYVLPYGLLSSYKVPVIFEVLLEGNLTLLCREYKAVKNIQDPYSYGSYSKEYLVYKYFFLDRQGNITEYKLKKNDLYNAVIKRQNQVIKFMKANNLHSDKRIDLIRIISFYNALL